tara:strand:- start:1347 stop:2210 length:864 start_codon:yes stop_codon:yes gene_type:complete
MKINYENAIEKIDILEKSERTKSNLKSTLRRMQRANVKSSDTIYKYIIELEDGTSIKKSTYQSLVSTISSLMSNNIIDPSHQADIKKKLLQLSLQSQQQQSDKPSEKEQDHFISLPKLREKVSKIDNIQDRLLVSLYIDRPPIRADYANILIVKNDDEVTDDKQNYYNITTGKIVLLNYKTANVYKQKVLQLSPSHQELIKASLDDKPRDYLFVTPKGQPYSNNNFSKLISKTFTKIYQKPITLLDIRHIYASHYNINDYSVDVVKDIADKMLHSLSMNVMKYQKKY